MNADNSVPDKPSFDEWLRGWLAGLLPFKLPRISYPKLAQNLDKAVGRIVLAGGSNISARLNAASKRIRAQAEADVALMRKAVERLNSSDEIANEVSQRALLYTYQEAVSYQQNRENILKLAAAEIEQSPPKTDTASEIDDDWLNTFTRLSQEKSTEDLQQIWAKILASEIKNPGACSLRTLDFFSKVNSVEAKRIVKIFSFVLSDGWIPRYVSPYEKNLMSVEDLLFADDIGIITGGISIVGSSTITLGTTDNNRFLSSIKYASKIAILEGTNASSTISIQMFPLSQIGKELYSISNTVAPDYKSFESFCLSLSSNQALGRITLADIIEVHDQFIRHDTGKVIFDRKA